MKSLFLLLVLAVVGCSSSSPSAPAGGTPSPDAGTTTGDDSGTSGPSIATTSIGPIDLAAGEEKTVCINKRLDNTDDLVASGFIADLAPGSHHLIVYRSATQTEQLTPYACSPFQGLTAGVDRPFLIVTKAHLEYALPSGVGLPLVKGQMLKIEAHYINASSAPIQGSAHVQIKGTPAATAGTYQKADVGVWGTLNINVPAHATFETPVSFQAGGAGMKVFGLTTHEHHLGTRMRVWSSATAGDMSQPIADDNDWANPTFKTFDPPLAFDGTKGMSYQCDYNNTTDQAVSFGESALNEMCFVLFYYYPSHGVDACFDGHCMSR
jgi:hypothetical protein